MTNDVEEGDGLLDDEDFDSLNFFGVAKTFQKTLRNLHCSFGCLGMMNFRTEQFIARMLLLLQYYRTGLVLSKKLDASLAYLQLQLGTNVCPFDLDYEKWGYFAPLSWTKMLWRTLSVSGYSLHLEYEKMANPRAGDKVVADMFQEYSSDKELLTSLQRMSAL